ncbi:hypothetical protein AB0E81_16245 [Streptomyces sp. NPDC033538]|uniref:hypothetical protein n=1 Tax=Streptomyces sp. NPDC033538 TaxID=3155367 RepID=UPI0033EEDE41
MASASRRASVPPPARQSPSIRGPLNYRHVDVFAGKAYTGNSLAVFPDNPGLSAALMLTTPRSFATSRRFS